MAAAQKGLDLKPMNENMASEGVKVSRQPEKGLAWVCETVGDVNSQPDQRMKQLKWESNAHGERDLVPGPARAFLR